MPRKVSLTTRARFPSGTRAQSRRLQPDRLELREHWASLRVKPQGRDIGDVPAGRSPICPSCGRDVLRRQHPGNFGARRVRCRGWLAQINADQKKGS